MESDKKEKYINWLLEEFNIELNEKNEKYFYGAVDINITYGLYSSRVLAFRGDALITFLVCDRNIIKVNADYDGKLTELQNKKQKLIGETFFIEVFEHYEMSRFTDYNESNPLGKKAKSSCIEAFIYAIYKSFDIERAWQVWSKILQDMNVVL